MYRKTIIAIFFILILQSCQEKKECCTKNTPAIDSNTTDAESLYLLESDWINQEGKKIKLESFRGKLVIAAMVFTHCESACPRIVSDIQRIEKAIEGNSDVLFVLISMDPTRDTPERFKQFGQERSLGKNWIMISSDQSSTDEVANVLGVKIKKLSDGGFDHSNSIFLLDANGAVIHTQDGLEQEPKELIQKLNQELIKL